MTILEIHGGAEHVDDVLEQCLLSGVFQPEQAAKLSEYSVGMPMLRRNPYGALLIRVGEVSTQLKIDLEYADFSSLPFGTDSREAFLEQAHDYLKALLVEYPQYFVRKNKLAELSDAYQTTQDALQKVKRVDVELDTLTHEILVGVHLGHISPEGLGRLKTEAALPSGFYELVEDAGEVWCAWIGGDEELEQTLRIAGMETLEIPDYERGGAQGLVAYLRKAASEQRDRARREIGQIELFIQRDCHALRMVYAKAKFLNDAYDLRKYVVEIHDEFHLIGFVMTRHKDQLLERIERIEDVQVQQQPAADIRLKTPVRLRNNIFVRPFEMFVTMYGNPSYHDIDPTPFVAWTYTILFGLMFGDVGQGFLIFLLGLVLGKVKKMPLGGIMSRIGISSMVFGAAYGSVFGYEHLLDPMFHAMGFAEKPIHVMDPGTTNTILLGAVGLGAAIILMVIAFNIIIGIKHRDFERMILSQNGLAGFVFYGAVLAAVAGTFLGYTMLTKPYIIGFFVVPLLLIFLKEPIARLIHIRSSGTIIYKDETLTDREHHQLDSEEIHRLFKTEFVRVRFGRIPTDSYSKISFYLDEPFMLYPIKTDREYIWCIYAMATVDRGQIDAIFHDLFFERIYIPEEYMGSGEKVSRFIQDCIDHGVRPEIVQQSAKTDIKPRKRVSTIKRIFPEGFVGFFIESFFELFEVLLSFVTNTMSFLRVGGFILSHAGMMSVVMTLSEMAGAGASPVVIVVGNLFVMALEGLIVGIQVLRLEFYEMFSRYYDADGESFTPVTAEPVLPAPQVQNRQAA